MKLLARILTSILVFQFIFPLQYLSGWQTSYAQTVTPVAQDTIPALLDPTKVHPLTKKTLDSTQIDPLLQHALEHELPEINLEFADNDPMLDQDPYFLRSQVWQPSLRTDQTWGLYYDGTGTVISFGANALKIKAPFIPLQVGLDYIIFSAQSKDLFKSKGAETEDYAEGLFFISVAEFEEAAKTKTQVPVYFFSMPEGDWTGSLVTNFEPNSVGITVAESNGDSALTIAEADLEKVAKAQRLNLLLASTQGLANVDHTQAQQAIQSINNPRSNVRDTIQRIAPTVEVLPPRGSTAGFGMLYTGRDTLNPRNNVQISPNKSTNSANAEVENSNKKMKEKLLRVSVILAIGLTLAVALSYTLYHAHFKKMRAERPARHFGDKIIRETKIVLTTYAHALTTVSQFASVTFGSFVEYTSDRYLTRFAASKNSWIRKFNERTIFWKAKSSSKVPVNWKTWLNGTIIIGGIDTLCVFLQLYHVVPFISHQISRAVPQLEGRVNNAFGATNPNIDALNRNEVVRNLFGYSVSGAADYAKDLKSQLLQLAQKEIEEDMVREGKDPFNPNLAAEKEKRINEKLSAIMVRFGLPGPEEFLFDLSSIYEKGFKALGYNIEPTENSIAKSYNFLAAQRPGLLIPSLKRAIKYLDKVIAENPTDTQALVAKELLKQQLKSAEDLRQWLVMPVKELFRGNNPYQKFLEGLELVKKTRRGLIGLTYDGALGLDLNQVPAEWIEEFGEDGARLASRMFRKGFDDIVQGEKFHSKEITPELRERFTAQAEIMAASEFQKTIGQLSMTEAQALEMLEQVGVDFTTSDMIADKVIERCKRELPAEFNLLVERNILLLIAEEKTRTTVYTPPKLDFFGKWQLKAATNKTNRSLKHFEESIISGDEVSLKAWKETFIENLMNQAGLFPDYSDYPALKEQINQKASELTTKQLEGEAVQKYLTGLETSEGRMKRLEFEAYVEATNRMAVYAEEVLSNESLKASSTIQPGRYQKIRQFKLFKSNSRVSKVLTKLTRSAEAVFSDHSFKLGLRSWFYRNVPFTFDVTKAVQRTLWGMPTAIAAVWSFNHFFWGADISMAQWVFFISLSFTIGAPSTIVNRFFQNIGVKPMGNTFATIGLAMIYTWATFWGSIPQQLFAQDFQTMWDAVAGALGTGGDTVIEGCKWFFKKLLP